MQYRRKNLGITNYKKRLELVKTRRLRLVVRKSLRNIQAQLVEYKEDGDKVLLSASTKELANKYGLGISRTNLPSSYLLGLLVGVKAQKKGIKEAILDIGRYRNIKGSRVYGVLKGAVDSGLSIPYDEENLPSEDRLFGKHIIESSRKGKKFIGYKVKIEDLGKHLNEIKEKILRA